MITKIGAAVIDRSKRKWFLPLMAVAAINAPRTYRKYTINENNINPNRPYIRRYQQVLS